MTSPRTLRLWAATCLVALGGFTTSCTVDQGSASSETRSSGGARSGASSSEKSQFAQRLEESRKERQEQAEKKAKERAAEIAEKKKAKEKEARELAARKAKEARELAARKAEEDKERARLEAEKTKEKARALAEKRKEAEEKREARLARRSEREENREVPAVANRQRGGMFSQLAIASPTKYKSKGHHVKVNRRLLAGLEPSNAKVVIDLSDQRARIYKGRGDDRELVIETSVSTGKPGHSTPTGTFRVSEKLATKQSSLYGTWVNSAGETVPSSGDSRERPAGGTSFVGADMPYWMRVTGGIGMHVGYVPDHPASHGCIRVPDSVQPLIYSKVGVGTPVTIIQ